MNFIFKNKKALVILLFFASSFLFLYKVYATPTVASGMVGYYNFDNNANDSVGSNNGVPYGSPVYATGVINKGLQFDGLNDSIVANANPLANNSNATISFWLKAPSQTGKFIINGGYYVHIGISNKLLFYAGAGSWSNPTITSVADNTWRHIAIVQSGTNAKIYVNGAEEVNSTTGNLTVSSNLEIGANNSANYFNGALDELIFYNRVLSPSEINQLYQDGITPPTTCATFAYSNWSACQQNSTQTRTIISSSPSGCTGGTPEQLTQSCVYAPPQTNQGIIFEDNFDGYGDWSSPTTYNTLWDYASTKNLIYGGPRAEGAKGADSFRGAANVNTMGNPLFQINSANARSGKSLKSWYESSTSVTGGGVNIWFGGAKGSTREEQAATGYDEVYVRFALKFDPTWVTESGNTMLKIIRLYTNKAPDWGDNLSTEDVYIDGVQYGNCQWAYPTLNRRGTGEYVTGWSSGYIDIPNVTGKGCLGTGWPIGSVNQGNTASGGVDISSFMGDWIIMQVYEKLNTPGLSDGVLKVWINNNNPNNPNQTVSNLKIRDSINRKWDALVLLDNLQGYQISPTVEQYVALDDLVVSTSFIDNNYVISGGNQTPQCSDSIDNDFDGKIDYPADPGCSSAADNDEANIVSDITPPVISSGSPSGILSAGTAQTTLSISTNESATCKYSTTANMAYPSMANNFLTTGGTAHSATITGLQNGQSYNYYVRCRDASTNQNTNAIDYPISFSVAPTNSQSSQGIIFEDNFDNYSASWTSDPAYGSNVGSVAPKDNAPFGLTADFTKAGWASYRYSNTANQIGDPVWAISTESAHSGTKAVKYEIENTPAGLAQGGGMTMYLGSNDNSTSGYKELYMSYWTRWEDTFNVPPIQSNGFFMKLFRVYFGDNADLFKSTLSSSEDERGWKKLATYADYTGNGNIRLDTMLYPDTQISSGAWKSTETVKGSPLTDVNRWARLMFHVKLNTCGNSDGLIELYRDNVIQAGSYNKSLVNCAVQGPIENNKITTISIPDNTYQLPTAPPADPANYFERAFYMDDVVISTNYVPLNYVPGGGIAQTPQCSDGIDNDSDGKIDYPSDPGCTSGADNDEFNDMVPPSISSPLITTTENSAVIVFITNETANSYIKYGLTAAYGMQTQTSSRLTSFNFTLSNLSSGTIYNFKINSSDILGNTAESINYTFKTNQATTPDITPPSAIINLSSSNITQTSAKLNWTAPGDDGNTGIASSYDIRYSTSPITDSNWNSATQVAGEPNPSSSGAEDYVSVGLSPNTTYYFAIKSSDEANNISAISNIISFKTLDNVPTPPSTPTTPSTPSTSSNSENTFTDTTAPAQPANFQASAADKQISLTWKNPSDPDFVRVKVLRTESQGSAEPICPTSPVNSAAAIVYEGNKTEYADINLDNNKKYCYAIFAYDQRPNYSIALSKTVKPEAGKNQITVLSEEFDICSLYAKISTLAGLKGDESGIAARCEASLISARNQKVALSQAEINVYNKIGAQIKDFAKINILQKYPLAYFIKEGSPTTKILGISERAGVINSFYQAFSKIPTTIDDWSDVVKIANGRWPKQTSKKAEDKAKIEFKNVYKKEPNLKIPQENAAVSVIAYGLRPANRNMNSEKAAIRIFKGIYKYNPASAIAWDIVRAIAYSGARR